jgi:hypothetical protein
VANEVDSSGHSDFVLSNISLWDTTLGCSLFEKHTNVQFSGPATSAEILSDTKVKTFLGKSNSFSLQIVAKGVNSGLYPQTIIAKTGVFSLIRTSATDVTFTVTNGTSTTSIDIADSLYDTKSTYFGFLFNNKGLSAVVNNEVLLYNNGVTFELVDTGASIKCSDSINGFYGYVDMLRLGNGSEYVAEFLQWYEPIWYLLSSFTDEDLTTYLHNAYSVDNVVEVILNDDKGDPNITSYIRDLMADWLGSGDIIYNPAGNLPLLAELGIF